jgi:uncharacterized protein (TIGR02996 family)
VDGAAVIPDSDEGRLVIADGLLERGDPRGELIAVQIRLARDGLDAPDAPTHVRRQDELLAVHGARWARALGPSAYSWRFRRGFVEEIAIDDERTFRHELFDHEAVRSVAFRSVHEESRLALNPWLARLNELTLDSYHPNVVLESEHIYLDALALTLRSTDRPLRIPSMIRRLALVGNAVRPDELDGLSDLRALDAQVEVDPALARRLESLDLRSPDLDELRTLLAEPGFRPRRLGIHEVRNGARLLETLAEWPGLAGLEELALVGDELTDLSALDATALRPRELDVSFNSLSPEKLIRSPIVECATVLRVGALNDISPFVDAPLPRLVVLDAEGTHHDLARELLERSHLPRLGRVAYSRRRDSIDPSELAPL